MFSLWSSFSFCNESMNTVFGCRVAFFSAGSRISNTRHKRGEYFVSDDVVCKLSNCLDTFSTLKHREVLLVCNRLFNIDLCSVQGVKKRTPQRRALERPVLWFALLSCTIIWMRFSRRYVIGNVCVHKCSAVVGWQGLSGRNRVLEWGDKDSEKNDMMFRHCAAYQITTTGWQRVFWTKIPYK